MLSKNKKEKFAIFGCRSAKLLRKFSSSVFEFWQLLESDFSPVI